MSLSNYEIVKRWRANNKDKVNAQARRRRAKHPEKFKAIKARFRQRHRETLLPLEAAQARARREKDPEGQRRRTAKFKAKQEAKLTEIAGRPRPTACDLCQGNNGGIVFDHCHTHGHFRGWLCDRCNKILGLVKDDPNLLKKMATYLET